MRAWIITWHWFHGKPDRCPVADIVSARWHTDRVRDHVQRIYNLNFMSLRERASMAHYNAPMKPPYEATKGSPTDKKRGIYVHCGHEPYLLARPVDSLQVETTDETEVVSWVELDGTARRCQTRDYRAGAREEWEPVQ